jgi:hypothetical protein
LLPAGGNTRIGIRGEGIRPDQIELHIRIGPQSIAGNEFAANAHNASGQWQGCSFQCVIRISWSQSDCRRALRRKKINRMMRMVVVRDSKMVVMRDSVTVERLRQLLTYDPETGIFTWIVAPRGHRAGVVAGYNKRRDGYRTICIDKCHYLAHRLAWFYMTGEWPSLIDHINGIPDDNRWQNLRLATSSQNCANRGRNRNNTSGFKGVSFYRRDRNWDVRIMADRKQIYLGRYGDVEQARQAYRRAAAEIFGPFARYE